MCGRLGGWRSGVLCATRVMLICADPGGRRTMVRRGGPLSTRERGQPELVAHSNVAGSPGVPGRHRPSRRDVDVGGLLDLSDRPREPGGLAGGRDGDDRPSFRALLESIPDAVQSQLG